MKVSASYNIHLGPRCEGAGLEIQFHGNQPLGIYFKIEPSEAGYRRGIERGLREGIELHPSLKAEAIWVTKIQEDPVDSSENAFYRAARLVIEQAVSLRKIIRRPN